MKLKIKFKKLDPSAIAPVQKGDWIDLSNGKEIVLNKCTSFTLAHTHLQIQIPKGFEAIMAPRSSNFKNYEIIQTNHIGIIDQEYCGPTDEWKIPISLIKAPSKGNEIVIPYGARIAQFRIQLSQRATFIQKLKWLISSGIVLEEVSILNNKDRGGFGSSGK